MLLGLIRVMPDAFGARRRGAERSARHFRANEALDRVQPRAGLSPFVFAVPGKSVPQHLGDPPAVRIPEPREHGARRRRAERFNELPPQQAQGDGVQEKHALAREGDDSAFRKEMKQFMDVEVRRAHEASGRVSN